MLTVHPARLALPLLALASQACVVGTDARYTITQPVKAVVLDLGKGDVEIAQGYADEVYVEVDMGGLTTADLGPRIEEDILYLEYRCGGASVCGGDLFVALPPGMPVIAELGAGDLGIHGISGNVQARLSAGDLWADDLASEVVWLSTGAGAVEADFTERPLDVDLSVGAGDAWLTVPEGAYNLSIDAGAGDISIWNVDHDPSAEGHLSLAAGAGAVTVEGMPRSADWNQEH